MSLFFIFALGMGTFLIILGTFAGLLTSIPKSGMWMTRINHMSGWILLAIGEYFLIMVGSVWV
jgi:thiol:disulfide interchange protein DsbD